MIRRTTIAATLLSAGIATAAPRLVRVDSTTGGTATATAPGPISLSPGQGVSLARSVFIDGLEVAHDTAEGVLVVNPLQLAASTGLSHGYLHMVSDLGTVVYNVPFDAAPDRFMPDRLKRLGVRGGGPISDMHVPFALSSADPVGLMSVQLVVTPTPLFDEDAFDGVMKKAPINTWPLKALPEAIGGDGLGTITAPPLPPIPDPGPPPPAPGFQVPDMDLPDWQYTLPWALNVEAARNQCVPAALANTMAYLEKVYAPWGVDFPQQNTPGVGFDGDEGSFVSRMDWYMDRTHQDTCNGSGTGRCGPGSSRIRGATEFLAAFDPDAQIQMRHQGGDEVYPGDCEQYLDRESHREGPNVTFEWLCDRVQDGAGITLSFGYYAQDGSSPEEGGEENPWERTGGHALRVFGCGAVGDKVFIRTVDDGQQNKMVDTDADDEVDFCEERPGLRTQLWFLGDPIEGRLTLGSPTRQLELAIAYTPEL